MRRARGAYSGCILSWLLRDARRELGVRISNVFSQVTRDRYQLNLRVRSWAHSRAQSVGVYRPSPLASAAAPAKRFTSAQSGANCGISVPAGCVRRLSFADGLSAVADLFVGFDHPTAAGGGHTKRPPLFPAGASLVPAQLRVAWNSLVASYKSPCGFFLPSTASPKAALRRSVVVRSTTITAVSSRTGEVPGAGPHGPSAPVEPNRLYCQLQPNAAVSELSSFVSQLCRHERPVPIPGGRLIVVVA